MDLKEDWTEEEFRKYINGITDSVFSKINDEEKQFVAHLINRFNDLCEDKALLQNVISEIKEYVNNHKIEFIDEKFETHNEMVVFNEYANPQAILNIIDRVKED